MTAGVPYAEVIGDPIAHSKSPLIHRFWLGKLGIEGEYRAVRVEAGGLGAYLAERLGQAQWLGCNVTMPLKIEALALAGDNRSEQAKEAGAANLLLPGRSAVRAENSDVVAVERLLEPHFRAKEDVVVHLIGTGGAAAAAAAAVRRIGPPISLFTYARSKEGALAFRRRVGLEDSLAYCHLLGQSEAWGSPADVVINATPLGMTGQDALAFPLTHFQPGALVFDMIYHPLETELLAEARAQGMRVMDGLQMLVEQAAMSFALFFGHDAPRAHDEELRSLLIA